MVSVPARCKPKTCLHVCSMHLCIYTTTFFTFFSFYFILLFFVFIYPNVVYVVTGKVHTVRNCFSQTNRKNVVFSLQRKKYGFTRTVKSKTIILSFLGTITLERVSQQFAIDIKTNFVEKKQLRTAISFDCSLLDQRQPAELPYRTA